MNMAHDQQYTGILWLHRSIQRSSCPPFFWNGFRSCLDKIFTGASNHNSSSIISPILHYHTGGNIMVPDVMEMIVRISPDPPPPCQWPVEPFNVQQGPSSSFVFGSDQTFTIRSNSQPAQWCLHMRRLFFWGQSIIIRAKNDHSSPRK